MTDKVMQFVRQIGASGRCLDVGSYDVNGSVRSLFKDYTGLDMRSGPNVDIVAMANKIPYPDESFEVVTCLEMLEHDKDPFGSVREMKRVLVRGGMLILTTPSIGFPRHDYPCDYWRFTADGLQILMDGMFVIKAIDDGTHSMAYGVKH